MQVYQKQLISDENLNDSISDMDAVEADKIDKNDQTA